MNSGTLGQIVSWKVPASVRLDVLRQALIDSGLSDDLAKDLTSTQAIRRALSDMSDNRVIQKLKKLDDDTVTFQITRKVVDATEAIYSKEALVRLHVPTSSVISDDQEIERQARDLLREHTHKRLTADLTRLVQRLFEEHEADMVPIREQGGAYFVPSTHDALVAQVRKLLAAIGGNMRSFAVQLGCGDTAQSVAESMAEYISAMIDEFRLSCQSVTSSSSNAVMARRLASIGEMRSKLEAHRGLLLAYADGVSAAIDAAQKELLAKLTTDHNSAAVVE